MFNDTSELISHDSPSEMNDDIDLSTDVSSHHLNNVTQDNELHNAEVEHCIETIGTDTGFLHFTLQLCDPIWHVSFFCSGVAEFLRTATHLLYFTLCASFLMKQSRLF